MSYYPPAVFSFKVTFEEGSSGLNGLNEGSFQEISGLSVKINTEEIAEGGENRFKHRFPSHPKFENLVLKRGILKGSPLINWARNALENFQFTPKNLIVELLGHEETVMTWKFVNAYPVALSFSNLSANENAVAVETLELAYQYFTTE